MNIDTLILVAIVDGVIFGALGLIYLFRVLSGSSKKRVVMSVQTEKPSQKQKATKKVVAQPTSGPTGPVPQETKAPPKDGLTFLISETRKNSKTCSVCGAYTTFYDNGKFIQEGMTSTGIINHLDIVHRGKAATSE